jgi:hypothetical protein
MRARLGLDALNKVPDSPVLFSSPCLPACPAANRAEIAECENDANSSWHFLTAGVKTVRQAKYPK